MRTKKINILFIFCLTISLLAPFLFPLKVDADCRTTCNIIEGGASLTEYEACVNSCTGYCNSVCNEIEGGASAGEFAACVDQCGNYYKDCYSSSNVAQCLKNKFGIGNTTSTTGGGGDGGNGGGSLIIENPLSPISDIWQLIMRLINIAQNIGVFVCIILIVWAGYLYVTSAGNEEKIKQAQKTLIWALVGFGILIIAGAIPPLIYEFITGKSWENLYNEGSSESGGDRGKYDTMELSNGGVYPASQPLGGMVYNSSSGECYWNEYANGDDSECTSDLLI